MAKELRTHIIGSTNQQRFLTLLSIIIILGFCGVFYFRMLLVFFPSCNSAGSENSVIYFIQRVLAGQPVYTDPTQPVYAIAQYTPLYYYLVAAIAKVFSVHHDQVLEVFITNRSTALVLDLSVCLLASKIINDIFQASRRKAYLTGAAIFIFILPWSRVDSLSVLFWFGSLYFFLKNILSPEKYLYLFIAVLLGFFCFLSKQSGLSILVIYGTWYLLTKQFKRLAAYCVITGLVILAGFFIFSLWNDLNAFYKNIVQGVNNGISLTEYYVIFVGYYSGAGLFFVLAFILMLFILYKQDSSVYRFFFWAMILQFVLTNLFALKYGSALNYLTEWVILIIMTLALFSKLWANWLSPIHQNAAVIIALVVIIARTSNFLFPAVWYSKPSNFRAFKDGFLLEKKVADYIKSKSNSEKPYVITDIINFSSYLNNLLPQQLLFPIADAMDMVYYRGFQGEKYNLSAFKTQAQNGQIGYFITKKPTQSVKLYDVFFEKLQKDTIISTYLIYRVE